MQNESNSSETQPERISHFGLIIGLLIAALALVLIGLYVWSRLIITTDPVLTPTPQRPSAEENNEPESTTAEARTETLDIVSPSDELSAIEADLEATQFDTFESDLNAIDAELQVQ